MTHTRSEILAMTPEQLWVEIAKRKGWMDVFLENGRCIGSHSVFGVFGRMYPVPDYPNDIGAAWGLVEEFLAAGCEVTLSSETRSDNKLWYVTRFDFRGDGKGTGYTMVGCWYADTAPLAISRAWLIWSEEVGG